MTRVTALLSVLLMACGGQSHSPPIASNTGGSGATGGTAGAPASAGGGADSGAGAGSAADSGTGGGDVSGAGGAASNAGGGPASGAGGRSAGGGAAGKPSGQGGGSGGQGGGSGGQVSCWTWDQMANQPKAGESGISACPQFDDIEFVPHTNCAYEATPNDPIPPVPGGDTGDCCYNVTYIWCR